MLTMSLRAFMIAVVMSFTAALVQGQVVLNDSVRTFTTLTNTTITLNGQSRLHLSGTGNPVSGSIIHLNSPDAWLHFDNLRPSTVQSTILGQIRVNGANAAHGSNVRIVQYGMGTVIIPFTNGIQPLETFTDTGFRGASMRHNLYTYYDSSSDLGVLYENISSFKLKRGFMATLGTRADGTGTSKVYIAQDHDVNVGTLPGNLDNAVRFVRVFPWRWVSKKGACDVSPDTLDAAWHYNWNNNKSSTLNWEYVPIRQQRWWPSLPTNSTSVTHFLGYNEPDNPVEDSYQSLGNGSRDAAIAAWPELLATGLRVGSPAVTDGGKWWLYDFMDKANAAGLRVDYIAIHFYQCGISATQLRAWLEEIWNRYRKPIWVTEFNNGANWTGCTDPTYQQNADAIASWIDMMDNTPWIERYAVYSNVEHTRFMEYSTGGLTPAGVVYKANRSPIGYLQESYPLAVRRGVALLDFDGDTRDSSGHDHRAVHHGAADFTTGNDGQAIDLNGSSDHLELPPGLINSNAMTFAAWVRWDGGAANQRIFDFGNDTEQFFFLSPSSGGQLRLGLRNNSGSTKSIATNALPFGTWQHVAVTVQGSAAKIFVNGSLQAQGSLVDPALSSTTRNYLGKSQWADDPLFDGRLDEVVILDSALPDSEIANLMSGVDSPYVAHWKGDVDAVWTTNNAGNTNWATDSTGGTDTAAPPASNTEVHFSSGSPNTTLGANVAIDSLIVSTTSPVGIGGSHDLTLGSRGIYLGENSGALNLQTSGRIVLGADQVWTQQSPNPLTVTSELAGDSRLVITGGGRVVLAGNNSHSGDLVIVGGGTVSVSSISAALGDASQILLGGSGLTGGILYTGTGETTNRSL
ncbi:MAG: glycosyl hydrolase, partial [Akkermansiaceae bacterium]|nr:glycosyl hydrolase [Akkermansiaceae bacterium]